MFIKVVFLAVLLHFGKTQNQCVREIRALKGDIQEEVRREIEDKATKEDVRQRALEVLNTLNNSVATGNQQIINTLLQMADSQEEIETLGEQCVTKDELRAVQSEVQSLARLVAEIKNNTDKILARIHTCNGTPGWRKVVFINMADTSYNCPPGLRLTSYSKRTCGRTHLICSSTIFSVGGSEYSRVCGRIRGYQFGSTSAFHTYITRGATIDDQYVDGVSLTHGPRGRRQHMHIWTFAAGISEQARGLGIRHHQCPCDTSDPIIVSPPFIGNDYFCETGINSLWNYNIYNRVFFPDDPLWDGQNCTSTSTCCQLNSPPWFTKTLPSPTTDDIEMRLCFNIGIQSEDTALELIELYVQ